MVHENNPPVTNSQQQSQLLETHDALGNVSVDNPTSYLSHNENPPAHLKNKILNISKSFKTRKPVDQFFNNLIEGLETKLPESHVNVNIHLALQQEYECQQLPPTELCHFKGNPSEWPEFISSFKNRVHNKISFNNNMRTEQLMSVLEGEAKRSVESIGCNGIFYATALKSLKRDFGNPVLVPHLKIMALLDQP